MKAIQGIRRSVVDCPGSWNLKILWILDVGAWIFSECWLSEFEHFSRCFFGEKDEIK